MDELRFPIGQFSKPEPITQEHILDWIADIESFPKKLSDRTKTLSVDQLNRTYRPQGWSVKQVVHHCADSHINSIIRFKLALTEDQPTIRPYFEDRWADLVDGNEDDISDSLQLIAAVHSKWVKLLKSITSGQMQREFIHPEHGLRFSIAENIGIYAWHCNHHLAHIELALANEKILESD